MNTHYRNIYLTALWAPLGFWILAAVIFSGWLFELATDALPLFMVWLWLGSMFVVIGMGVVIGVVIYTKKKRKNN